MPPPRRAGSISIVVVVFNELGSVTLIELVIIRTRLAVAVSFER